MRPQVLIDIHHVNELVTVDVGSKCAIHLEYLGVTGLQLLKVVCFKHGGAVGYVIISMCLGNRQCT